MVVDADADVEHVTEVVDVAVSVAQVQAHGEENSSESCGCVDVSDCVGLSRYFTRTKIDCAIKGLISSNCEHKSLQIYNIKL